MFGNDDGRADNDYATSDGQNLGPTPSREVLNTTYTDSWRLTPSTSLFDYGPEQSTATFTDPTFPHANVDASNAPNRAAVEQQCRDEGITDTFLLQDCILDASAINDYSVLSNYSHAQTVTSVRSAIAHGVPAFAPQRSTGGSSGTTSTSTSTTTTGPVSALRTVVDAGRVNDPSETVPFTFPASAGDVVWIGPPDCDAQLTFALVAPNGKVVNKDQVTLGVPVCQAGRFDLPADGNYQLVANADKKGAGSYTVPVRFQRKDVVAHAAYGQKLSGNIPQTAAHDVYLFDAHAGDLVHISGPGCDIGPPGTEMTLGTQTEDGKPAGEVLDCTSGRSQIMRSGTYKIIVNFADRGPGSYSFVLQK